MHPEYQTRYDDEMEERMLDYRVRIRKQYGKPVYSLVVWLTDEQYPGPGCNRLVENVCGREQLIFEFDEIRVWELDPEEFLSKGDIALLPLIPLMGAKPSHHVLTRVVEAAEDVEDESARNDLHTAISVLGSLRYDRGFISSLIKEEAMKESPIFQEIMQKGAVQAVRDAIVKFLTARFGDVPEDLVQHLEEIRDVGELDRLVIVAGRCQNLAEFAQEMLSPQVT